MLKYVFFIFSVYLISFTVSARADTESIQGLENWTESFLLKYKIPGASVSVLKGGDIIYSRMYGLANVENNTPVTKETVFEIGSISKQFLVALILMQQEELLLDINDPVQNYLPYIPSEWRDVSVYQLMAHTSGIPDYEAIASYDIYGSRLLPQDIIRIAHSRPMDFKPGTGWNYSNTGYFLLSLVAEAVEKKPLEQLLKERIFNPLKMFNTQLSSSEQIIMNRASGYWVDKLGNLINRRPIESSSTLAAGGVSSTLGDMAKWDKALRRGTVLSEKSRAFMWREVEVPSGQDTNFGLGWEVGNNFGSQAVWHSGMVAGFKAHFNRYEKGELTILIFANRYRVPTRPILKKTKNAFVD